MNLIEIGIIVNTHGIKGELRIISNFEYKDKVFIAGNKLYVNDEELVINSYRPHKQYDMVTFKGLNSILEVQKYKSKKVYFNKSELILSKNEYLDEDLISLNAYYNNELIGKIDDVEINANKKLFVINNKLIPYNENFVEDINLKENKIILKNLEGLI